MFDPFHRAGSADSFQSTLDHLQKNSLPSFSIGDCPQTSSPIGIATASSNPYPDCSDQPIPINNMTAASATTETLTDVVSFTASESSEIPEADVSAACSFLIPHSCSK